MKISVVGKRDDGSTVACLPVLIEETVSVSIETDEEGSQSVMRCRMRTAYWRVPLRCLAT